MKVKEARTQKCKVCLNICISPYEQVQYYDTTGRWYSVALEKGSLDGSQGTSFPKVRAQVFVVIVGKGVILNSVQHDKVLFLSLLVSSEG